MPKFNLQKYIVPKAGRHAVILSEVREIDNQFYDPEKDKDTQKTQFEWIWTYVDISNMSIHSFTSTSPRLYKENNIEKRNLALQIVDACLGKETTEKDLTKIAGTDPLLGKKIYITVEHVSGENSVRAKITKYEPFIEEGSSDKQNTADFPA